MLQFRGFLDDYLEAVNGSNMKIQSEWQIKWDCGKNVNLIG